MKLRLGSLLLQNSGKDMKPICTITMRKNFDPKHKDNCKLREKNTTNCANLKVQVQ